MLSKADNERMCRVGPGTPMGEAARRYWLPALLSEELPAPDCDPMGVTVLGERLVAFRDTQGRVGLLQEFCRHRGASLTLGRVEGCGIRCIYHGWKFAADGTVMETPNVADPAFKNRFKAEAYPTHEAGGIVWAYLGPPGLRPPAPDWPWLHLPARHRIATVHSLACNYVQVLEGLVDSSHLGILHANSLDAGAASDLRFAQSTTEMRFDLAPTLEVEPAAFGFRYAALRNIEAGRVQARITAFAPPGFVFNPNGDVLTICVPASDERTDFYHIFWDAALALGEEPLRSEHLKFVGLDPASLDTFGLSRRAAHGPARPAPANRYHQDRARMARSFSGLPGLIEEDAAVSVASGAIRDRSRETLSKADVAVQRLYQVLLDCAHRVDAGGAPPGADGSLNAAAGLHADLAPGADWRQLVDGGRLAAAS